VNGERAGRGERNLRRGSGLGLFAAWYLAGLAALVLALAVWMALRGVPLPAVLARLPRLLRWISRDPFAYILALVPYVVFVVARSLTRAWRQGGARGLAVAFAVRALLPAAVLVALGFAHRAYRREAPASWQFDSGTENTTGRARGLGERDGKVRGANLVAGRRAGAGMLDPLLRDNVEWISVSPFGWQERLGGTEIEIHPDAGYWTESDSGIVSLAAMARARGMKLMLKPQLWIMGGSGGAKLAEVGPATEPEWSEWFASYRAFLLHYAALAERAHVDLLCVGAELTRATTTHPEAWRELIAAARRVYHGRLTYGANWSGEARAISFWDALDAIGVQAYYPLASRPFPPEAELEQGWAPAIAALDSLHARWGKPILFTEVGWKSTSDAAVRPWEWTENVSQLLTRVSTRVQADAYEAFFRTVWKRPWFGGAFIWKWYANHMRAGGPADIDFTPQNKPAEAVIAREFGTAGEAPAR
jgi:hypothetical protein